MRGAAAGWVLRVIGTSVVALGWAPAAAEAARVSAGDAIATVNGNVASLQDGSIVRRWQVDGAGHVVTTALLDPATQRQWSSPSSADFSLTLDGAPTSSVSGWSLLDVTPGSTPPDPARPDAGRGVQLAFRYGLGPQPGAAGVELDRTYRLYPGSPVIGVSSTIVNPTAATLRISDYSLDELSSAAPVDAEVQTFHGGSDWRDDYRQTSRPPAVFDDEGEAVRFDDGSGAGWFFVTERRSGLMSRVGREASGRTWAGVDHARDAFDYGPLESTPPGYNRAANPAYPVPARARVVAPLSSLDLGRAYTGVYHDGAQSAAAAFVSDFTAHVMPQFPRSVGMNSFHPWGHGADMSDANLRHQIDAAKALGVETFMLDDQWQGGAGGKSGDWRFDPARFPTAVGGSVPDFVNYVHAAGLKLALWMSPVEFHPSSQTYAAHPDWACAPTGDVTAQIPDDAGLGVWDVTNAGFQRYLLGVIDRLVADYNVVEFKFDFMAWVDCPPHDYLDYEAAFVAMVREMQRRHPSVAFELDETNDQRAWPFESAALGPSWFDNGHLHGSTAQSKLLHDIWTAAPWVPASTIGFGTYDGTLTAPYTVDYLLPISLLGHVTFWSDLTKLSAADRSETTWWLDWYKVHRADLASVVYENTGTDPADGKAWAAFQPWHGDHGFLFAFRQSAGEPAQAIPLQAVEPAREYTVTDVRTGELLGRYTGAQLRHGLSVALPRPFSARVLSIDPLDTSEAPRGAGPPGVTSGTPGGDGSPGGGGRGEVLTFHLDQKGSDLRHSCASRRRFRIRLRTRHGERLRSATVYVNGRPVRVLTGRRLRARVDLRGLPPGKFTVRVLALTTRGRRLLEVRRYRTCTKRRPRRQRS